ncbi:hypothetical protein LR48_Vigan03g214100 [Vigna angularis]|uniref:Uncharacterized protein n=1 Tax=Phaseolus angularis TaxID=3914 RepID=A0A0L9U8G2_PHAAN|nr:hypothetical protein LR48_Vigan03g214100 [Vigna angularis]
MKEIKELLQDLKKSKKFFKCGENSGNLEEKKEELLQDLKKSKKLSKGGENLINIERRIEVQNITSREKLGLASISMEENAMINYEGDDKVDKNKEPEAEDESHDLRVTYKHTATLTHVEAGEYVAALIPSITDEDYQYFLTVDDLIIGFDGILQIEPNSKSIAELQDEELKAAKPEQIEVGKTFVEETRSHGKG